MGRNSLPLPLFEQEYDLTSVADSNSSVTDEAHDSVGKMLGLRLVDTRSLLRTVQRHAKYDECGALMEVREDLAC